MTKKLFKIENARLAIFLWLPGIFSLQSGGVVLPEAFRGSAFMEIRFENITDAQGKILVAVYDKEADFLSEQKVLIEGVVVVKNKGSLNVKYKLDKEGRYAIAAYHDVNGNGKFDKNFLGVPIEPYAFSNNVRPNLRAPKWSEACFSWKPGGSIVTLKLEKW